MVIPAHYIEIGQSAFVVWMAHEPYMKKRLEDIGFQKDAKIKCVLKGKKGEMIAYLVRDAVIALRKEDASRLFVKILP